MQMSLSQCMYVLSFGGTTIQGSSTHRKPVCILSEYINNYSRDIQLLERGEKQIERKILEIKNRCM